MDLIIVAVATLAALLAVGYTFILSSLDEIKKNWVQYRCNPMYMPFASLVGVDTAGNFMRCTVKSFQDYAGFVFDPINRLFGTFLQMFSGIAASLNSMRAMFNGIRTAFLGIVTTIFGKLANTIASMQYLMIRIRTVFLRVSAVMYSMMNIMNTGISSGKSVMNGPVGKTISFLCFAPETRIRLADGASLDMASLKIGDVLEGGDTVTGLYVVIGNDVSLFRIGDTLVSGGHRLENGTRVDEYYGAIPTSETRSILSCIDTDTGQMTVGGQTFRDFEFDSHENPLSSIKLHSISSFDYLGIAGLRKRGSTWEVLVH